MRPVARGRRPPGLARCCKPSPAGLHWAARRGRLPDAAPHSNRGAAARRAVPWMRHGWRRGKRLSAPRCARGLPGPRRGQSWRRHSGQPGTVACLEPAPVQQPQCRCHRPTAPVATGQAPGPARIPHAPWQPMCMPSLCLWRSCSRLRARTRRPFHRQRSAWSGSQGYRWLPRPCRPPRGLPTATAPRGWHGAWAGRCGASR
jgi:hypothetical protein